MEDVRRKSGYKLYAEQQKYEGVLLYKAYSMLLPGE